MSARVATSMVLVPLFPPSQPPSTVRQERAMCHLGPLAKESAIAVGLERHDVDNAGWQPQQASERFVKGLYPARPSSGWTCVWLPRVTPMLFQRPLHRLIPPPLGGVQKRGALHRSTLLQCPRRAGACHPNGLSDTPEAFA